VVERALSLVLGGPHRLELDLLDHALAASGEVEVRARCTRSDEIAGRVVALDPDVALLCVDSPGWEGLRACREIKASALRTRVVLIGRSDQTALMASVKAGADGYLTAAEGLAELASALRRVRDGESSIPATMLGALLRGLIEFRREDDRAVERFASLGKREREVLADLVEGLDHQAIAARLHLSPHTTRTHTQNVFAKLGVHSRLDAARLVHEHDLFGRFGVGSDGSEQGAG